jgi:hypothetical protein
MRTFICCAHAGGQGKTTVAQALYAAAINKGLDVNLVAADFRDETGSSKLGRLFPGLVTELGTGPAVSLAKEANDLNANVRYWDVIGPVLLKGGSIIDMGANVIDQLLQWGSIRRAPMLLQSRSAPPIDVFLVCKAEKRAIDDMSDLVHRFGNGDSFPVENIFVVLNEHGGTFEGIDLRSKLASLKVKSNIEFIELPRCSSELWHPMEQRYVSIQRTLGLQEDDIVNVLGVEIWSVLSGMSDLQDWFGQVQGTLRAARAL